MLVPKAYVYTIWVDENRSSYSSYRMHLVEAGPGWVVYDGAIHSAKLEIVDSLPRITKSERYPPIQREGYVLTSRAADGRTTYRWEPIW